MADVASFLRSQADKINKVRIDILFEDGGEFDYDMQLGMEAAQHLIQAMAYLQLAESALKLAVGGAIREPSGI